MVNLAVTMGIRYWNSGGREQVIHFTKKVVENAKNAPTTPLNMKQAQEILGITPQMSEKQAIEVINEKKEILFDFQQHSFK